MRIAANNSIDQIYFKRTKSLFITNREIESVDISEMIRPDGLERAGDNFRFGEYKDGKFILFPEPKTEMDIAFTHLKETNAEAK